MKNFTIRLAGQYFTICPVCDYITEYCKDYIVADVKRGALQKLVELCQRVRRKIP